MAHKSEQIDLERLRELRGRFAGATYSPNTIEAYRYRWEDFARWCSLAGRAGLPADEETVSLYLVHLVESGHRTATAALSYSAISHRHTAAGYAFTPQQRAAIRAVLRGARRHLQERPAGKAALSLEQLSAAVGAFRGSRPSAVRARSILALGFAGGFRRSELAGIRMADVEIAGEGVLVNLAWSKTDRAGEGRMVAIYRATKHLNLCPVRLLEEWIETRGRAAGALYCMVHASGRIYPERAVLAAVVQRAVKIGLAAAGIQAAGYSAHSLRAGFVTEAYKNGASEAAIMRRTGHRSTEMVHQYIRPVEAFAVDPLRGLL